MVLLQILQIPESSIVFDYALSDSAYKDLNDKEAMVVAMKQVHHNLLSI